MVGWFHFLHLEHSPQNPTNFRGGESKIEEEEEELVDVMAELKNEDEEVQQQQQQQHDAHGIPPKRKTELTFVDEQDIADNGKKQRSENSSADKNCSETKIDEEDDDEEEDYEQEDDEDEDDEDEDFDEEHSNGEVVEVDRKGKGILREDKKGKGKLIQESDDDDSSDDDGGGGGESDGNSSDLSEDPLAEVDLDNILPSRTRRRSTAFHPGVCLSKDPRKNADA